MTISDYAEVELLDAVFNNGSFAVANTYVQLHTGTPGEAGTTNVATETARKEATWAAAASGAVSTDAAVTWTNVAATETVQYLSIWDASTNGNCLWTGQITTPSGGVSLTAGDTLTFDTGDITVTLN